MKKFLLLSFLVLPLFVFSDILYEFSGKSWTEGSKKENPILGTVFLKSPSYFRIEFKESGNPLISDESVIISKDLKTIYLLNTKDKTYSELNFEELMQSFGSMAGSLLNLEVENPKVEVKNGTENKTILGYPCKHIIMETSYDMKMKVLFMKSKQRVHYISEYWVAPTFPLLLRDWYQERSFKTGIADLDKLIEMETSEIKGMVLKVKRITETKNEKGEITKVYDESEITKIEEKDFPLNYFEIPKDYKKIEFFPKDEKEGGIKSLF